MNNLQHKKALIQDRLNQGFTQIEIAKELRVNQRHLRKFIYSQELQVPSQQERLAKKYNHCLEEISILRSQGKNYYEIQKKLDIPYQAVASLCRQHGMNATTNRFSINSKEDLEGKIIGNWQFLKHIAGSLVDGEWQCKCLRCHSIYIRYSHNILQGCSQQCKECRKHYSKETKESKNKKQSVLTYSGHS